MRKKEAGKILASHEILTTSTHLQIKGAIKPAESFILTGYQKKISPAPNKITQRAKKAALTRLVQPYFEASQNFVAKNSEISKGITAKKTSLADLVSLKM